MTTARSIISGALTFHLNRLSPGESVDSDTAAVCLSALNDLADEINGGKSFLWREIFTASSPITGTSGTLGTTWAGLGYGEQIIGATVRYGGMDIPLDPATVGTYANIPIKTLATIPVYYAHDGATTVYIYPAAQGLVITLRTKQVMSDFADLDTDYEMPKGYKSALSALLAERVAGVLLGGVPVSVGRSATMARTRIAAQNINPAIIDGAAGVGPVARIKRGY